MGLREGFSWDPLPEVDDPYSLFDRGLEEGIFQPSELHDYLESKLRPGGRDPSPGALHKHLAELAAGEKFPFIVDTNYDLLLRRAMMDIRASHTHSVLQQNIARPNRGCWYLSIHGDMQDWANVILSKQSYRYFDEHYRFLRGQLDLVLIKHPMLFVGCSMTDPRLLDWILGIDDEARKQLKTWVAILGPGHVARLERTTHKGRSVREILSHAKLIEVPSFDVLPKWFDALARPVRARRQQADRDLVIEIEASTDKWRIEAAGQSSESDPITPTDSLVRLRALAGAGLPCDSNGELLAKADAATEREMRVLAHEVGRKIASLLPGSALAALAALAGSSAIHGDGLVRVRARGPEANAVLVLPWELLVVEDRFPVERGELSVVREAVAAGVDHGLPSEPLELSVVAHVAAPMHSELPELNLEEAAFRMARALVSVEDRTLFTDLGTLEDLERAVESLAPVLLHFAGHAEPGYLVFENHDGGPMKVSTERLLSMLRRAMHRLPSAIWLSCCYGAGGTRPTASTFERTREWGGVGESSSIAADLHRAGVPQVLGYFGPVPDPLAVEVDRSLFEALAKTGSTLTAVSSARERTQRAIDTGHGWARFPLAWTLIGLYHRGANVPLTVREKVARNPALLPLMVEREPEDLHGLESLRHGFIGRRRLLATMRQLRTNGRNVLGLWGLGGLGKTAVMTRLTRVFTGGVPGWQQRVLVLPLKNLERNFAALREIVVHTVHKHPARPRDWADQLRRIETIEGNRGTELARVFLGALKDCLLYVDNAEALQIDPAAMNGQQDTVPWCDEEVASFFRTLCHEAPASITVLCTTRYRPAETPGTWVAIEPCTKDEIFRMMQWFPTLRSLPAALREELAARRLAGHPRSVEWAEALLRDQVDRCIEQGFSLTGATSLESVRERVFDPALARLSENAQPDLLLESLIQHLRPNVRALLGECCEIKLPVPINVVQQIGEGAEMLQARGLLTRFESVGWAVHPLVREAVQRFPSMVWTPRGRSILADYWMEQCRTEDMVSEVVLREALEHLLASGRWSEAKEVVYSLDQGYSQHGWVRARREFIALLLGRGWPDAELGFVLHRYANALEELGQYEEAEVNARRAVAIAEGLGMALELTSALHGLANVLTKTGQYGEAEKLYERCIALQDEHFPDREHAEHAAPWHGLAAVRLKLGRYKEAELAERKALDLQERVLKTREHSDICSMLIGLAQILTRQERYEEAEQEYRDVIRIWKELFGARDHSMIATALNGLALVLAQQSRHSEAEPLFHEAIAIKERVYENREHPAVAASLAGLANTLRNLEKYDDAEIFVKRALVIQRKMYRSGKHLDIASALCSLGKIHVARQKFEAAVECFRESVAIEAELIGTRRGPATLPTLQQLAELLAIMLNRPSEALEYAQDAWEGALATQEPVLLVRCGPLYVGLLTRLSMTSEADAAERILMQALQQLPGEHPERVEAERLIGIRPRPRRHR